MKTLVLEIKRNSLDDGPGIRSIIFFKGCPLSCVWCQNPESKNPKKEISFDKESCVKCRKCEKACEIGAVSFFNKNRIYRDLCDLCGKCVEICQGGALKFVGKEFEIKQLVDIVLKDKVFYQNSGGGVTLSGGEPTLHMEYLNEFLKELKKEKIHICLETCGLYNRKKLYDLVLPYLDLVYYDLKIYDTDLHKNYCFAPNEIILQNFEDLLQNKTVEVLPRIPLIPDITATEDNLNNWVKYLKSLKIKKIGLLPYNPLWLSKVDSIGVELEYNRSEWLTKKEKTRIKEIFSGFEFRDF